jgi:hypothetical protein
MKKLIAIALSFAMLPSAGGINRIDFGKANKPSYELVSPSKETEHSYNASLSDIVEFSKMREHRFYPFVANVQRGPNDKPLFTNINNPLYVKSIAVSAIIQDQTGKRARHEIREILTQELVGEYEADINFNPVILGKEYPAGKIDPFNKDYEVKWFIDKDKKRELGKMLFGKHGIRILVK